MDLSGEDAYLFRHPVTRDGAYQLMPPSIRARLHVAAAQLLLLGADDGEATAEAAADAAAHYEAAIHLGGGTAFARRELLAEAARVSLRAAVWLNSQYRIDQAITLWRRVATNPAASSADRIAAAASAGGACEAAGRVNEIGQIAALVRAVAAGEGAPPGALAVALRLEGQAALWAGRADEGEAALRSALGAAREAGEGVEVSRALSILGVLELRRGRLPESIAWFDQALEAAVALGKEREQAVAISNAAIARGMLGNIADAEAGCRRAAEIGTAIGDRRMVSVNLGNLALLARDRGDLGAAESGLAQALHDASTQGDRRHVGIWLSNLAMMKKDAGAYAESESLYRQAIAIAIECGDSPNHRHTLGALGQTLVEDGRVADAKAVLEQALALARRDHDQRLEGHMIGSIATLLADPADAPRETLEHARRMYREAIAIHENIGNRKDSAVALGCLAGVLRRLGSHGESDEAFDRSIAELTELNLPLYREDIERQRRETPSARFDQG